MHRVSGLQLIISAILTWNSIYFSRTIETLRTNDLYIPHVSPLG
nr:MULTISPECIES: hypothetical protein [Bacillus cereus group]